MPKTAVATHQRDWWVAAGLTISAASAAVSSFGALRGLAIAVGWPVGLAPLLPITVDAYAMTASRVWLAGSTSSGRARRFARANSVGAILLSLAGNAVYHLIAAHLVVVSWLVVVLVGAVPALVLGLVSHLAVLTGAEPRAAGGDGLRAESEQSPDSVRPEDEAAITRPYRSETELLEAAREADRKYRETHAGRSIPRDELRRTLHVGGGKATELLRYLKAEQAKTVEHDEPP